MANLENAIQLATNAHKGQEDKSGVPYILHPLRVMVKMQTEIEMMTAVLHDVVEDTTVTLNDLRKAGYPEDVVAALDCLTRRQDEIYEEFIERIKPNKLACRVKLGDLEDNMDIRRLDDLRDKDSDRLRRYLKAWKELTHKYI